nr:S8 family peptidase [Micromonospora sp. DSM 115978]
MNRFHPSNPPWWRRQLAVVAAIALTAGAAVAAPGTAVAAGQPAPLLSASGTAIPGSYLVVLEGKPDLARTRTAAARATSLGAKITHRYGSALNGYAATLTPDQVDAVRADPAVAYIAPNQRISLKTTQTPANWGLDRVDQRALPLNNTYEYERTGAGVTVYVIDSGIRASHLDFGGRVGGGFDATGEGWTGDCIGHGTHVAGTIGSGSFGVAKSVRLVPVRVFACSPYTSTDIVVAGVDWVTANAGGPAVVNMSLGGPADPVMDDAVANSINSGITYVVAAGNAYGADACQFSPAHLSEAVTVAATDATDTRAAFSNVGSCVDLFAPGVDITSLSGSSDTGYRVSSGTSMAAPHVAGAAALHLEAHPADTPDQVSATLLGNATHDVVSDPQGSPNLLLFTGSSNPMAMTWRVKEQRPDNLVLVGSDEQTNPYQGDTPETTSLPVLCLQQTGAPIPAGITPDFYNGWSAGSLALTAPVPGTQLTSFAVASQRCEATFGGGWRMAEFHDGYYLAPRLPGLPGIPRPPAIPRPSGWSLWGHGTLPTTGRFWAAINDQLANPWD